MLLTGDATVGARLIRAYETLAWDEKQQRGRSLDGYRFVAGPALGLWLPLR